MSSKTPIKFGLERKSYFKTEPPRYDNCITYATDNKTHRLMWIHLQDIGGKDKGQPTGKCAWVYKERPLMAYDFGAWSKGTTYSNITQPKRWLKNLYKECLSLSDNNFNDL